MTTGIITRELLDQSILFARFAAAAYSNTSIMGSPGLEKFSHEFRLNEDNSPNETETQAVIGLLDKRDVVIAFRGTESKLADWWTDMRGRLVTNPGGDGRVHNGFKSAADSVYPHLVKWIGRLRVPESRLFVCGHSLGGALALIVTERLAREPGMPPVRGVFTYGAPRVGDDVYAVWYLAALGDVTTSWVATNDPVTRVAPYSLDHRHAARKQFTLSHSAIGVTELDGLMEIAHERDEIAKWPIIQGTIGVLSWLSVAILTFDSAQHSMVNSYLRQLIEARASLK